MHCRLSHDMISIHAPNKGSDMDNKSAAEWLQIFQSTPPTKGATDNSCWSYGTRSYFNPRPQQRERRGGGVIMAPIIDFNPRPQQRERPSCLRNQEGKQDEFQSTPPTKGATKEAIGTRGASEISIHAPNKGSDRKI